MRIKTHFNNPLDHQVFVLRVEPVPTNGWMFAIGKSVSVDVPEAFTVLIVVTRERNGSI